MNIDNLTRQEAEKLYPILLDKSITENRDLTDEEVVVHRALAAFEFYYQDKKEFDNYTQMGMLDRARRAATERDKNYQKFLERKDALAKWAADK
jgi:hypothetical protein